MPKPSALSALSYLPFCGILILFVAAPQAAGQNPEPEKAQTENVRPPLYFNTGGPYGLRVEQSGAGMGTHPNMIFTMRQAPAPPIDSAMVVKPLAPACGEKTSVQKPGFTMPLTPNRR